MPPRRRRRGRESDDDIEYGFRRSRRRTSYHYRAQSSLTPAQMMERDIFYQHSEISLHMAMCYGYVMSGLFTLHQYYQTLVGQYEFMGAQMASYVTSLRNHMQSIMSILSQLVFISSWITCLGEMCLLYAEDLTVYIRRRRVFPPKRNRRLEDIDINSCYQWFGLTPYQLMELYNAWRIPIRFRNPSNRQIFDGEECFIIMMYHIIKGTPYTDMSDTFGGDPRDFSIMFDLMIRHLYYTFYNKISGTSLSQWIPSRLDECRQLILDTLHEGAVEETVYDENGVPIDIQYVLHHFDIDTFRPFGFLDDMGVPTANVGNSPRRRHGFFDDLQRAFYSGYLRMHGLKAQVVFLPIGIIAAVFITEIRQNDNGVQNISGLNNYLVRLLSGWQLPGWLGYGGMLYPALYCDGIFAVLATILPRFRNPSPALELLNIRLASLRECIEHVFADHKMRFRLFSVPYRLQIFNRGVKVRHTTMVSFFILNCYYCLCGTRSTMFGQLPPTLEEYLPLNEVLVPPPAVELGDVWDYWDIYPNNVI